MKLSVILADNLISIRLDKLKLFIILPLHFNNVNLHYTWNIINLIMLLYVSVCFIYTEEKLFVISPYPPPVFASTHIPTSPYSLLLPHKHPWMGLSPLVFAVASLVLSDYLINNHKKEYLDTKLLGCRIDPALVKFKSFAYLSRIIDDNS